jgi:two-component sensor histidine kinase
VCETTPASSLLLPPELTSGRRARRFVEEHWCAVHDPADPQQVQLLVTELVSNAVRHGGPPVVVAMDCSASEGVVVSVSDGSAADPVLQDVGPHGEGGRGVRLVDLLSVEWGVERGRPARSGEAAAPGKTVWCRLVA